MAESNFNAKSFTVQAQKKVLGKMASKKVAKAFIDDTTGDLLDQLYQLVKKDSGSKKEAEKIMKDLIKIVVKLTVLFRNNQFNQNEIALAEKFRRTFKQSAMTFISFCEVDFSFDKDFLCNSLEDCKKLLHQLIERHLTAKSHGRVDHVFGFFTEGDLLERVFEPKGPHRPILTGMVANLNKLMEEGNL